MNNSKPQLISSVSILVGALLCSPICALADDGFVKDSISGCSIFKPNLKAGEIAAWRGTCVDGVAEGNGVAQWNARDGSSITFEGRFSKGRLEGPGKMSASGGDRYVGGYRDGKRDGRGTYISANGERYEGEYRENQRHGQGVITSPSGVRTVGEWRNGLLIASNAEASAPTISAPTAAPMEAATPSVQQPAVDLQAQQAEQNQRLQLAAQQQEAERVRREQAAQAQQRQTQLAESTAQEQQRQTQFNRGASADASRRQGTLIVWAILAFPLVVAAIIVLSKWSGAVTSSDRFTEWIDMYREKTRGKTGPYARFFLRPVLWCFQSLAVLTASIENTFVRAATRVAAWLYLAGFVLFLLYWITVVVIAIVMLVVGLWLVGLIFGHSDGSRPRLRSSTVSVEREDAVAHAGLKGKKVYAGTNWFNEELKGRVDTEGNLYKGTNWFNEERIGRIDGDGNIYSGTNVMNEVKVGRIDEDGTLYKGSNWFVEEKTGRIDNDGIIHQGNNWLNEQKKGRAGE